MLACLEALENEFSRNAYAAHGFDYEFDLRVSGNIFYIRCESICKMFVTFSYTSVEYFYYFYSALCQCAFVCAAADGTESHDSDLHFRFLHSLTIKIPLCADKPFSVFVIRKHLSFKQK